MADGKGSDANRNYLVFQNLPMKFIYLDESEFAAPRACIGYASLMSPERIERDLIECTMNALHADPDRHKEPAKKLDDRTLDRGYFHASDDSKNAHSHLCKEISKTLKGRMSCDFQDPQKLGDERKDPEFLRNHTARLSAMHAVDSPEEVTMIFESRQGLTVQRLEQWWAEHENEMLQTIYDTPYIPTFFPKVSFEVVGKDEPGVQCADFILWAVSRHVNSDSTWLDRIRCVFRTEMNTQSRSWGGVALHFQRDFPEHVVPYEIMDFPPDPDKALSCEMLLKFYLQTEYALSFYTRNPLPPCVAHLGDEVRAVCANTQRKDANGHIEKVAALYLKLFDMVPLMKKGVGVDDKKFLLLSKKYMALILRKDLINGVRTHDYIARFRQQLLEKEPEKLKFG